MCTCGPDRVRIGVRVTGVSRTGRDRIVDADRDQQPFVVHVAHTDGREERLFTRAAIDASGTWTTPSPAGGLAALGEKAAADRITYRVPDLKNPAVRARYAGKRTTVIGSGASAFTALACLAGLAKSGDGAGTKSVWILRRNISGSTYGGGEADQLPARGALGLAAKPPSTTATPTRSPDSAPKQSNGQATAAWSWVGEDGRRLGPVDEVIVLTGFRPDLSFLDELRLAPRRTPPGPRRSGPADRPQPALLRHRPPPRPPRALPPRTGRLPGRKEVLRPRPDLPRDDRLRAGPLRGRSDRR